MGWWVLAGVATGWIMHEFDGSSTQGKVIEKSTNNNNNNGGGYGHHRRGGGYGGGGRRRGGGYGGGGQRRGRPFGSPYGGQGGPFSNLNGGQGLIPSSPTTPPAGSDNAWLKAAQQESAMMKAQAQALQDLRTNPQQACADIAAAQQDAKTAIDGLNADINDACQKKDYARVGDDLQLMRSIIANQHAFQYQKSLEMRQLAGRYGGILPGCGCPPNGDSPPQGGIHLIPNAPITPQGGNSIDPGFVIPQNGNIDPGIQATPGGGSGEVAV